MKKIFLLLCIFALFFVFASCGGSPAETPAISPASPAPQENNIITEPESSAPITPYENTDTQPANPTTVEIPANAVIEAPSESLPEISAEGGGYSITVDSAWIDKDYTGAQVIAVKFLFTNNNSSPVCFADVINVSVSQNGAKLNGDSIIMDGSCFNGLAFNFRNQISKGATIPCVYAYPYSSSDNLDISVQILTDFNSRTVLANASGSIVID